ncbi:MAG: hypothetical protein AAF772_10480, partial [Acidobacteriota bacterium]
MIGKLFSGKKGKRSAREPQSDRELTIDDLITLERYEDAADALKARIKRQPKDLHAHLRMAEVQLALNSAVKAIDEYVFVADSYADDGFFDKAIALLSKAQRLAPADVSLLKRIERYKAMKLMEQRRGLAVEGLKANKTTAHLSAANSALQLELLWNKIVKCSVVRELDGIALRKLFQTVHMLNLKNGQNLVADGDDQP